MESDAPSEVPRGGNGRQSKVERREEREGLLLEALGPSAADEKDVAWENLDEAIRAGSLAIELMDFELFPMGTEHEDMCSISSIEEEAAAGDSLERRGGTLEYASTGLSDLAQDVIMLGVAADDVHRDVGFVHELCVGLVHSCVGAPKVQAGELHGTHGGKGDGTHAVQVTAGAGRRELWMPCDRDPDEVADAEAGDAPVRCGLKRVEAV